MRLSNKPGTIVVDPHARFLYLVMENGRAMRYRQTGASIERLSMNPGLTVKVVFPLAS